MSQYNSYSGQNNRRGGNRYPYETGRSDFMNLLLFYILPFLVVNLLIFFLVTETPKASVTIGDTDDYRTTSMELKIKSILPVKEPIVTMDGVAIELQKTGRKTYTATLTSNGNLEINLSGKWINRMKNTQFEQVSVLDDTPPSIKDEIIEDGILSFRLEDSQSKVDFSSIYASTDEETDILPLSIDRSTGTVTFEVRDKNLTISAKDTTGNELLLTINPSGETLSEDEGAAAGEPEKEPELNESSGSGKKNKAAS